MREMSEKSENRVEIQIDDQPLTMSQIQQIAANKARVTIGSDPEYVQKMQNSQRILLQVLQSGKPVYGVSTGYGRSCGNRFEPELTDQLGYNLIQYHGAGVGEALDRESVRAAIACRITCLALGRSGVSLDLLKRLADLLNRDIVPVMPQLGSVGASGDLTPMSYIAACLLGEREVFYRGKRMSAKEAFKAEGLSPYRFQPKEPLGVLNGTSVMTGIAAVALRKVRHLLEAAVAASALTSHALAGHDEHFHPVVTDSKPHPGQIWVGQKLRELLQFTEKPLESDAASDLQDPYSVRCPPQILGVLADALEWIESWVQREINSSNDNPLTDPDSEDVLRGGNFYGGHIAFAMDALKPALAQMADMLDRQLALLVDPRFNRGLPENLVMENGSAPGIHHAFKGLQITASALVAEAQKNTMPAAVFSRSTESHNQDIVSMGTIAARDVQRQLHLVSRANAIHLMAAVQACEIRGGLQARPQLQRIVQQVREIVSEMHEDRPMDAEVERLAEALLNGEVS